VSRRAPLIAGIAFGLVTILVVVFLVLPKMGQVGDAEAELTTAQDQESSLMIQLGVLQDAQADAPETQRQIEEIQDQVPPTADLPTLFRLLQAASDNAAVDFFSFTPGSPTLDATGAFSVMPSQITISGSYFAVDEFLFLIETLQRAAKVTGFTLSPGGGEETTTEVSPSTLQMTMTVEFYTTDASAGPGSLPGPTEGAATAPAGPAGPTGATTEPGAS
jgi:Tfp pilus assembly protein PilO